MLELLGDIEDRVGLAEFLQHFLGGLLHHLRARIVILVHAVAEAHQAERVVLVLGAGDIFGDVLHVADFAQHVERGLVGAAMRRAPQAGDPGRDARERVGARRSGKAHGRGRGVLLMVGMEDEDPLHRALDDRVDLIGLGRDAEGHAQEIAGVAEVVLGEDERLADRIFIRHRGERRHLGDQPVRARSAAAADR